MTASLPKGLEEQICTRVAYCVAGGYDGRSIASSLTHLPGVDWVRFVSRGSDGGRIVYEFDVELDGGGRPVRVQVAFEPSVSSVEVPA